MYSSVFVSIVVILVIFVVLSLSLLFTLAGKRTEWSSDTSTETTDGNTNMRPVVAKDFLYVITRVRNENVLLKSFVTHYINQGADRIYLLDDDSTVPYDEAILSNPRVVVLKSVEARRRKEQMYDANELYRRLRSQVTWVLNVDVDEFVHSRSRRKGGTTIRRELETTFKDADCVFVPWIMFSFNGRQHEPQDVVKELVYRWNHDRKHPHPNGDRKNRCRYDGIECKAVFKTSRFESMKDPHHPTEPVMVLGGDGSGDGLFGPGCPSPSSPIYVDGATNRVVRLNFMGSYYSKIREKDISTAHLICNHYRFTSLDKIREKCQSNSLMKYHKMGDACVENCVLSDHPEVRDEYLKNNSRDDVSTTSYKIVVM